MINQSALYPIGHKFTRQPNKKNKNPQIEEIVDIYTTTNNKGEIVKIVYVTAVEFMGHKICDSDVQHATIVRGSIVV